jgi:hypothetical protein
MADPRAHPKATPPEVAARWRRLAEQYIAAGLSRTQAYRTIACDAGVHPTTVWRNLHDVYRAKDRAYGTCYRRRPEVQERRRRHSAAYRTEYGRRPEVRSYQRWYHRLIRNPKKYGLGDIFRDGNEHTLADVRDFLRELSGVPLNDRPVKTFLDRYIANARVPHILKRPPLASTARAPSLPPKTIHPRATRSSHLATYSPVRPVGRPASRA